LRREEGGKEMMRWREGGRTGQLGEASSLSFEELKSSRELGGR